MIQSVNRCIASELLLKDHDNKGELIVLPNVLWIVLPPPSLSPIPPDETLLLPILTEGVEAV